MTLPFAKIRFWPEFHDAVKSPKVTLVFDAEIRYLLTFNGLLVLSCVAALIEIKKK